MSPKVPELAVIGAAEGVAVVFDQPEFVLFAECLHVRDLEWITESVGKNYGLGFSGA